MASPSPAPHFWTTPSHTTLQKEAERLKKIHLKDLLKDEGRSEKLIISAGEGILCDISRQKIDAAALNHLLSLAKERNLAHHIERMFQGEVINGTEGRAVMHVALRSSPKDDYKVDGKDIVGPVQEVLSRIQAFSDGVRSGSWKGHTGQPITSVICIGIGGSYLGPEFVYEALRNYSKCRETAANRTLRFLANVDPVDVQRATEGLTPESTLVVVISKTFTTAETMLNARALKKWLIDGLKDEKAIAKHMVAVSTNVKLCTEFGILAENVFGFWDWVGGRFSVCSAVGCLPLSLQFGFVYVREFLDGCRLMDLHFRTAPLESNLPVLLGLIGIWNSTYLHHNAQAILPYSQSLLRFAAHIQQVTMESNGKRVTMDGTVIPTETGEVFFGEPGTNGQHSFYQLLHQGQVVPADFIGFIKSQNPINLEGEPVPNHEELMSNFFAQPDALALGLSEKEVQGSGVPQALVPHKVFAGDRPSTCLLLPVCSPLYVGVLLSLYEHRTAVQGFIWGNNSFDQWGVELGKVLAKNIRNYFSASLSGKDTTEIEKPLPYSTKKMLKAYMQGRK